MKLQLFVCIAASSLFCTKAEHPPKEKKIEIKSTVGDFVRINCSLPVNLGDSGGPGGPAVNVTWTAGGDVISSDDPRYTLSGMNIGNTTTGASLGIHEVTLDDRKDFTCTLTTLHNGTVFVQRYRLRVRDPLGAVWPVIGIVAEALLLVIYLLIHEQCGNRKGSVYKFKGTFKRSSRRVQPSVRSSEQPEEQSSTAKQRKKLTSDVAGGGVGVGEGGGSSGGGGGGVFYITK